MDGGITKREEEKSSRATAMTAASTTLRPPKQEQSGLAFLKDIQTRFRRNWVGIDCEIAGRVGTSNITNKKRKNQLPELFTKEEERQARLAEIFSKIRDYEEEQIKQAKSYSGTYSPAGTRGSRTPKRSNFGITGSSLLKS